MDNTFYDVAPTPAADSDSFIDNWYEGFLGDALWIQECIFTGTESGYELPEFNCFHIDIGWHTDSRIDGQYYARLKWCSEDELRCTARFESTDRFQVRDKLEFWMEDVKLHYDQYKSLPTCG